MSFLPQNSAVIDVKAWMAKCDELVKLIENLVAANPSDMLTQSTMDPQFNEEAVKGVVELGYRDVRHFCHSFPAKFLVNDQLGIISLRNNTIAAQTNPGMNWNKSTTEQGKTSWGERVEKLRESIKLAVAYNRVDGSPSNLQELTVNPERNSQFVAAARQLGFKSVQDFCERCPDHFIIHQTGVITARPRAPVSNSFPGLTGQGIYLDQQTGAWLKDRTPSTMNDHTQAMKEFQAMNLNDNTKAAVKMEEKIHFKITHAGTTRRFALSRAEEDLLSALKARVLKITGTDDVSLFWKDEDSLIVLDCADDLAAAVDYAETQNKLACVVLETGAEKKEEKEVKTDAKVVTSEESEAAFNGFVYMCDACDCYLAPSNGGRFKCTLCDNYDLCAACLAKGAHDNHAFVRLLNGETEIPLRNEAGGVLSTIAKDMPRCSPTFVVKSGDTLKSADKIFIDVIDSVGKHVGKKMYDTAQWMKKEAEKMSQRREEAEVEEQKMVEEIIRRERDEERKRHMKSIDEEFQRMRTEKREEMQKRREEQPMKDAENAAEELRAKLEQTVRDRRMAEQMWREEKNKWKGTRKQFKKEEKQLRKSEKVISKSQKEASKHQERHEKKPEEKRQTEEEQNEEKLQYSRAEMMSLKESTVTDPAFEVLKEQQREAVDVETSDSSDDSDVELIDKPASEKNSISSDLIMLDDQKEPAAAEEPSASLKGPINEGEESPRQQEQQPKPRSIYPELPTHPSQLPYGGFSHGPWRPTRREVPFGDFEERGYFAADGGRGFDRADEAIASFLRGGPTRASEPARRGEDRRDGGWGESRATGGWGDYRRDSDRDVRERGFGGRRADSDLERQASQSRAERESRWRTAATRPGESIDSELFAKAARIPAFMEISVLSELKDQGPEEVRRKLAEYIALLENNAYSRERHATAFTSDQRFDNELIRTVAGNLMKRLRSMQKIVQHATVLDCPRMISNRIHELTNNLKSEENPIEDERQAETLREILLTSKYTAPRYGFNGFGAIPPLENFGQGLNSFMDQSRASLSNYLSGFMPMAPPYGGFRPPRPAAAAAAARDAADAAAAAATAASMAAESAAGAASASAPAEEKPDTTPLTDEQQKVLRELFATGMFEDYDKMIKICRKATDLHEAIDMMLD